MPACVLRVAGSAKKIKKFLADSPFDPDKWLRSKMPTCASTATRQIAARDARVIIYENITDNYRCNYPSDRMHVSQ